MKKREDQREQLRQKRREFVNAVLTHQRNFKDFHNERSFLMKKLTRQVHLLFFPFFLSLLLVCKVND
jgi:hypothetical protein